MNRETHAPGDARNGTRAVVVLADDASDHARLGAQLAELDYDVRAARDVDALHAEPEVALVDAASGVEGIEDVRRRYPDCEVVVLSAAASVDAAVASMRAGAFDYIDTSAGDATRVADALARAVERRGLRLAARAPRAKGDPGALAQIVAVSSAMSRVVQTIRHLSHSTSSVLIEAESGTGKELVARSIHETSPRAAGPFVPVDCGALPEGIVEGELFGYARGAFTGAHRASAGLFRSAHGGTLFLDEIGELPLGLQAKLLRAIQEREVRPLGTAEPVPVDARIIAATNRDLGADVRDGRFRSDLFYRLRVVALSIPPLRERRDDIPPLAARFLARSAHGSRVQAIETRAIDALRDYAWPGNVRELENTIEAALALAPGPNISVADLRLGIPDTPRAPIPNDIPLALEAYEAACLREVLRRANGDVTQAARILGIGRSTLYRKLARHRN